jgi:hypothetical protein
VQERETVRKYLSFQLTTWGLVQNVKRGDVQLYSSTLFSEISCGQVVSIRNSWLAIIAALSFFLGAIGLVMENNGLGIALLVSALIFVVAYLVTKKTVLRFTNTGGVTMSHVVQGNQRQGCAEFIHQVEAAKLRDRIPPTSDTQQPSEDS